VSFVGKDHIFVFVQFCVTNLQPLFTIFNGKQLLIIKKEFQSFRFFWSLVVKPEFFPICVSSCSVVSTSSSAPGNYSGLMTTPATTTTMAPSMVTSNYVMPSCQTSADQLTASLLANYPGLNLSGFLQPGQTISSQSKLNSY
jgi:hypothetical protein